MAEETLRLGVDPRPAQKGMREYKRALSEGQTASKRLADTVEASARRETDIYRKAARERLQLERQLATGRTQQARVSATAAAEAFVRAQEQFYQTNIARIKAAQARGLMSPSEARAAGQQAAAEYNAAIVGALDRPQYAQNRQAFTTLAGSIKNIGESGRSAGVGMHRLNNSLVVLARRATGAHPVVGQLTDVVGTFAIGTAAMVPILAGIAALAAGIRLIGAEAFEARKRLREARDTLDDLAEQQRIEAGGGPIAVAGRIVGDRLAEIAERNREINEQLRGLDADAPDPLASLAARRGVLSDRMQQIAALRAEQEGLQREAAGLSEDLMAARADAAERAFEEEMDLLNRRARAQSSAVDRRLDDSRVAAETERQLIVITTEHEERLRRQAADRAAQAAESRTDAIEGALERELEAEERAAEARRRAREREQREEERRLRELQRARDRAMRNLIRGLNEVGRAFGGTADQILSMTAAILSLESVPMESGRDRVVGYGSAALAGAGFGASTGSPFLGGVGGAIGGNMIAGDPAGAIIGGVSGIITGLMEQGRRAQQAAAQWKVALRDFELMFEDLTPMEQSERQLERAFAQAVQAAAEAAGVSTSITSLEEAQAFLRQARSGEGPGILFPPEFTERLEQLIRQYEVNAGRLEENTDELRNLTGALNAPSGFRQSYFRWLAQGVLPDAQVPSLPPTGGGGGGGLPDRNRGGEIVYASIGQVDITVTGAGDPNETADVVMRRFEQKALLGGPEPLSVTRR